MQTLRMGKVNRTSHHEIEHAFGLFCAIYARRALILFFLIYFLKAGKHKQVSTDIKYTCFFASRVMPWTDVSTTVRRSKTGKKNKKTTKSLQQLPQNFSFLERLLRHLVFYHQRLPSAGSASPFCPPPALRAAGGGGPGRARAGPGCPRSRRRFPGRPEPLGRAKMAPAGTEAAVALPPEQSSPPASGEGRPPPIQPLARSGGGAASPSPPGRALRRGEAPRTAPPPTAFSRRALSPHHLPPPPPGPNGRARPQRLCATRSVPLPYGEGEEREGGQFHRFKAGCNLPSPHGGMGAGGKGGERIGRVKFNGEREGPEKGKEKEKGERYCQAERRRQPERRPGCGGRYRRPPPPFFPQG